MQSKTCTFAELFPDLVDSSGEPLLTMEDLKTAKTLAQQFELATRKKKSVRFVKKRLKKISKFGFPVFQPEFMNIISFPDSSKSSYILLIINHPVLQNVVNLLNLIQP